MDRRIEKAFEVIKREYHKKLSLKDLAARVELSPFHFQRLFKKETGETPLTCLNRVRLEKAAHLIKANLGKNVSEIAFDCGFTSLSVFSRAFSKKFGVSPQAFVDHKPQGGKVIYINKNDPPPEVTLVYQPDTWVFYTVGSIADNNLLDTFMASRSFCEFNDIPFVDRFIGISTYTTFHYPDDPRNYYAGIEVKGPISEKYSSRIFHIPAGKYACEMTDESIHDYQQQAARFMVLWLNKSEYLRRELFSFDEIDPAVKKGDYPRLKRKVFVPVKKK